ncbi:MAG: protein kinase [Planctomycetes bacterium]|nr:protein kinase [Planctomycetota bacterium]
MSDPQPPTEPTRQMLPAAAGPNAETVHPVATDAPTVCLPAGAPTIETVPGGGAGGSAVQDSSAGRRARPGGVPEPTGEPFGRYRLVRELGRGGMGVVYQAWDTDLKRWVALKTLLPEAAPTAADVERFLREARAAGKLHHPNVVQIYDVGTVAGRHFFTMDFIAGESLDSARARLEPRRFLEVLADVARALHAAHEAGVVHRDVKPANVLLDGAGRPYVSDFGLAKEQREQLGGGLTVSGAVLGTPPYMSPEQAQGQAERIGPRSDLWGLGVMLYEHLAGRPPFEGRGLVEVLRHIVEQEPLPPTRAAAAAGRPPARGESGKGSSAGRRRVHPDLERICLTCLEKDPARRYASAAAFADDLARFLDGEPIAARAPSFGYRAQKWLARRRVWAAAGGLVLLAGGVAGYFAWRAEVERGRAQRSIAESAFVQEVKAPLAEALGARRGGDLGLLAQVASRAERRADELLAQDPTLAAAHYVKGWLARLQGRMAEAERALGEAIRLRPDDASARYQRGLARADRYRETLAAARRAWDRNVRSGRPLPDAESARAVDITGAPEASLAELETLRPELARIRQAAEDDLETTARLIAGASSTARRVEDREAWVACGRGVLALLRGDLAVAERELKAALELDPYLDDARLAWLDLLGRRALTRELDSATLLVEIDAALKVNRGLPGPWRLRSQLNSGHAQGYFDTGRSAQAFALWQEAEQDALQVVRLAPPGAEPLLLQSTVLQAWAAGKAARGEASEEMLGRALELCVRAAPLAPDSAEVLDDRVVVALHLARAEAGRGTDPRPRLLAAAADATRALELGGPAGARLNLLGCVYRQLGLANRDRGIDPRSVLRQASDAFGKSAALNPALAAAAVNGGLTWTEVGEVEATRAQDPGASWLQAVACFDEALRREPKSVSALVCRAKVRLRQAEFAATRGQDPRQLLQAVEEECRSALKTNPESGDARLLLGMAGLARGEWESGAGGDPQASLEHAVAEFGEALKRNPEDLRALEKRAVAWSNLGRNRASRGADPRDCWRSAIADLDQVLRRNPESATALESRGADYSSLADYELDHGGDPREAFRGAIADISAALTRNPEYAIGYNNRAYARFRLGVAEAARGGDSDPHLAAALADADAAVARHFGVAELTRGEILRALGRHAEAIRAFETGARADARWAGWAQAEIEKTRALMEGR